LSKTLLPAELNQTVGLNLFLDYFKYLTAYLSNEPNPDRPLVIQENGSAAKMDTKIRLAVHEDKINRRDLEEIIENSTQFLRIVPQQSAPNRREVLSY
tara:strand:- start:54 stop:347 length:294 start_codon:yes stop_codon:yes gene_type:complete